MFTTLSFVNEKHIRTVSVDNTCDSEVKPSKNEGEVDNDYSTDKESEQSHDGQKVLQIRHQTQLRQSKEHIDGEIQKLTEIFNKMQTLLELIHP